MGAIVPIPTTRVSNMLIQQRTITQLESDQQDLLKLQNELSTGQRINLPSDDPTSALKAMGIQRMLDLNNQSQKNISANTLYLNTAQTTLTNVSNLIAQIRASALSIVGTASTDTQRQSVGVEVDSAISQLTDMANQNVNGRYLFSGSATNQVPFQQLNGTVEYNGNDQTLQSYSDVNLLFPTNMTGDQIFGGFTAESQGTVDLNPDLTPDTLLSDLHGGDGIDKGTISISDGNSTKLVDLSQANTVGDVVSLIEANAPTGRTLRVDVTSTGLNVTMDSAGGGALTIKDVGGGTTASDLGIARNLPDGTTPIVGTDLDPRLTVTTKLANILGSRATANIAPAGANNDLIVTANHNGAAYNNVAISFVDGGPAAAGHETAVYDSSNNTLTVTIASGTSNAEQVISAIDAEGTFSASLDSHEPANNGLGTITATASDPSATGTTAGGSGTDFDQSSGLLITNNNTTKAINFNGDTTIQDLLNTLNAAGSGLSAQINQAGTGIDIQSRISGADFEIGENGGTTASQLGVRTFTANTQLASLNYGQGVTASGGTDFTIQRTDGTQLQINLTGAQTVGDVLNLINNDPQNQNPATRVVAQLAPIGNGIQLVDDDPTGTQPLQVIATTGSLAAQELGLVAVNASTSAPAVPGTTASATLSPAGTDNDITLTGVQPGTQLNSVQVSFVDTGLGPGNETVTYNASAKTLVFDITTGVTSANTIANLVNTDPTVSQLFHATLAPADGSPNNGTGTYDLTPTATLSGGTAATLTGTDPNPQEVSGVFNALLRLQSAINSGNDLELQRAVGLLDDGSSKVDFANAEAGAQLQSLSGLTDRLSTENTNLNQALSDNLDADMTQVITELTGRETSFQAALQATAQTYKLTLLDYL